VRAVKKKKWGGGRDGAGGDGGGPSLYQQGRGGGRAVRKGYVVAGRGGRGPVIPGFYAKTKFSSYVCPRINGSTHTAKSKV
jgi:hypothetical protein